jgi:hypothetical protein
MKQQNAEIGGKKARSQQHTTQPTIDSVELWLVQGQHACECNHPMAALVRLTHKYTFKKKQQTTLRSTHVPPCNGKLRWTCINDRQVGPGYKTKTTSHKEQKET